ncbi:MAG TPA: efflux RND transporter periplasmic adaptor subunit [Streptosporangiaceae bacterium]|nr:efflux RND transporter periplasmic adaptor subunit [Streptosporangiaceae bacterium]
MSATVSRDGEVQQEDAMAADGEARLSGRRRRAVATVLVLVVLAAGAGAAWAEGAFGSHGSSGTGQGAPPPATARVVREDLSSQAPLTATLGYANSYTVQGQGGGTLTWLPPAGQVISQGQVLYRVDNGTPVVLLYGSVPDWRTLDEGLTGADVSQLNHDLVALGYASSSDISSLGWDYFSAETAYGVQRLESAAGVSSPPGSLSPGSVVFEPDALRISSVPGSLGGPASGQVLAATSDQHVVTIAVSTSDESGVAVGDAVTVTLPNGASTPGKITSVGTVATGTSANATIQVTVTLTDPSAAGTLDQAPVTVYITVASASNVLVVPVAALVAQSSGGYAVEVVGAGDTRRLVPVTVGIFDDSSGAVQVTGELAPGEQVVVPAT